MIKEMKRSAEIMCYTLTLQMNGLGSILSSSLSCTRTTINISSSLLKKFPVSCKVASHTQRNLVKCLSRIRGLLGLNPGKDQLSWIIWLSIVPTGENRDRSPLLPVILLFLIRSYLRILKSRHNVAKKQQQWQYR